MLTVTDITKRFDGPAGQPLEVLCGVSLSLSPHDTVALIGPNGCGKSTLLNIIAGDLSADSGSIRLNGTDLLRWPAYRRSSKIGRVHQESYKALATELTVAEILAIASKRARHLSPGFPRTAEAIAAIRSCSPSVADFLGERIRFKADTLSGGQRQLLAIAVAVLGTPQVLLLDEHRASLDEQYRAAADGLLMGFIHGCHAVAIAATHDREWALTNCSVSAEFCDKRLTIREYGRRKGGSLHV